MVKASYKIIFTIIKKIRGIPLYDLPNNWIDIMQSFDRRQRKDKEGLRIAEQILKETSDYLRVIGSIDGKDCPKYIVASTTIADSALEVMQAVVESVCIKASIIDLQLHNQLELYNRICECQIVLQQIEKLYMIDEVVAKLNDMKTKLAIAEKRVDIFRTAHNQLSSFVASHSSTLLHHSP